MDFQKGLWLASPLPALYDSKLLSRLQGWVWAPKTFSLLNSSNVGLLPPTSIRTIDSENKKVARSFKTLPLREDDGQDPFLIIITQEVQIALALQGEPGERNLLMRSDPAFKEFRSIKK